LLSRETQSADLLPLALWCTALRFPADLDPTLGNTALQASLALPVLPQSHQLPLDASPSPGLRQKPFRQRVQRLPEFAAADRTHSQTRQSLPTPHVELQQPSL